jgi:hypothetical protein
MSEKTNIRQVSATIRKRKEKRERVAKALFTVIKAVDDQAAPDTYEDASQDEREEFEAIVDGLIELWDALAS